MCSSDLEGDGDACDLLYLASWGSEDDEYFQFAATCANTEEFDSVWCGPYVARLTLE